MSILRLGSYPIHELFSFLEYKRRLQICSRSNQLSKMLYIKKSSFKLYNYLINAFKKYNIFPLNLQNLYDKTFEYFENELGVEDINLIFSYFLQSLENNPVKDGMVKLSPLFDNYYEFLGIQCPEFELKLVSLYDIEKNDCLKNEKITILNINFTISSSMEKDIPILHENLNYLLSLNQYKNIQIVIVGEGVFTQDSFDCINLEKLEKLQLSFMDLSSNDIINFFTKVYDSHKKYPLISLDLSSNKLDDECSDLLCWVIEINFPELKKINIHGNNFTSDGAERILQKLHKSKEIDIALNKVGKEETDIFNRYNKRAKELKIITDFRFNIREDFEDNKLTDFYEKFKDLKKIELFENNSIDISQLFKLEEHLPKEEEEVIEKQLKNIPSCLNKMKQVENINFTGTYKAGKILEKCDNSFLEQLKDYSLSYCKLSNKCVEITGKMKNLETFDCLYVPLTSELINNLSNSIKNNLSNLRGISLYHTFLTSKSVEKLIYIINNMKDLLSFVIAENDIGTDSIIKITKSLSENCHDLTILDISKTINPHNEGLNELWDSLSKINNLNKFKCQDNCINAKDILLFKNKLSDNFIMLNHIDFSYNIDIDATILNDFLPEFKKYLNHVEVLLFWGVGTLTEDELNKFRGIFPGRIKMRNKKKRS